MKELWIHAGMPKNGSSALQSFFAKNIENLKYEGIDYPSFVDLTSAKNNEITSGNGINIAKTLLNKQHLAYSSDAHGEVFDKLLNYILNSRYKKILISSEYFFPIFLPSLKEFVEKLRINKIIVKYIYYVRRQDQFLISNYMQQVKRHLCLESIEPYIRKAYQNLQSYYSYAKNLEQILNKDNIIICIYENTKKFEKGLCGHFCYQIMGKIPKWVETQKSVNTSPNNLELKLLLASNLFSPRATYSDIVVKNSIKLQNSGEYQKHNLISDDLTKEILDFYKEDNEKLFSEFTNGEKFPDFIPSRTDLDNDKIDLEELIKVFAGLFVNFDTRLNEINVWRNNYQTNTNKRTEEIKTDKANLVQNQANQIKSLDQTLEIKNKTIQEQKTDIKMLNVQLNDKDLIINNLNNEINKLKNSFIYKLGEALIKASKTWYKGGYVKLIFEIRKLKKEFKKKANHV